jgi:hypothetical protein
MPQGLNKMEIEPMYFTVTFASLKSLKVSLYFLVIMRNKNKKESHNLNLLLLVGPSTFDCPVAPTIVNPALKDLITDP